MNRVAEELDRRLKKLDRATAEHVERLVLDALALAGGNSVQTATPPRQWPEGYFTRTAGALAGDGAGFDRPQQGSSPTREAW